MQGFEAALWRALTQRWLDREATVAASVLDWLVHDTAPTPLGVDIAWLH